MVHRAYCSIFEEANCSELQLCSSPVSAASVVPDFVVSPVANPVGQRAILLLLLRHSCLLSEGLNRSHYF